MTQPGATNGKGTPLIETTVKLSNLLFFTLKHASCVKLIIVEGKGGFVWYIFNGYDPHILCKDHTSHKISFPEVFVQFY